MKQKRLIGMFMAIMIIVSIILTINSKSTYAAADNYVLGLTNVREAQDGKRGAAYGIGGLKSNGTPNKKVWKIVSYPKVGDYTISYANAFYCMKAEYGFMLQADNTDVTKVQKNYNLKYDMKSDKSTILKRLQAIDVFKTDATAYNKVMWIIDNMYLPKQSSQSEKIALLINAGIIDNANELQYASITDDDIEVVQQMAIWYFTNNSNSNYNGEILPELLFNNWSGSDSGYNTFSDLFDTDDREYGKYRQEECEMLYSYFITGAKAQGSYESKDAISPLTLDKARVEVKEETGSYLVGPYRINKNSDLTYTTTQLGFSGASYTLLDANKNIVANNEITLNQDFYIRVPVSEAGKNIRFDINISYPKTSAYYYTTGTPTSDYTEDQPVVLVEKTQAPYTDYISVQIPVPIPFDLSLRKFISEVDGKVPSVSREPIVDVTELKAGTKTTANYNHTKAPLEVNEGSIITYTIRVYNEGKQDGYATEITDHLPPELEFLPDDSVNKSFGWSYDTSDKTNRTIKTNYLSKANGEKNLIEAYDGGDTLNYKDIKVRCKLKVTTQEGKRIVNIADITDFTDRDGNPIIDRDSQKNNVELPNDTALPGYKQTEINRKDLYIPGQQDDDDFDSVYIKVKPFDLSLRKFISAVNGEAPKTSREPIVDVTGLKAGTSTTATYNHPKAPLSVEIGDIVTYTIRIYNEGQKDGYVNEITDHLPAQLEFLPNDEDNIANGWVYDESDTSLRTIKTSHLSRNVDTDNIIKAYDGGNTLDYKEVTVKCKVIAAPTFEKRIVNIADITAFSDKYGNPVTDRDSQGGNVQLPPDEILPNYKGEEIARGDSYIPGQQDDDDFDNIRIIYFDLSLRKFITAVNGKVPDINREPVVDISGLQAGTTTTAIYNHPKAPLTVRVGDIVTYTIRVYNEGPKDGYASEITDHLPAHLEFLPDDKENIAKGWVYDESDETHRTIKTDYLSKERSEKNIIKAFDGTTLSYKEISVNCKVVTTDPKYSDRIVNIAEITKFTDEDGHEVKDVDSDEDNVKLPDDDKLPDYKGEEIDRGDKYIPGQEDDDDFDSVVIEYFDLALRKFITKVNTVDYNNRYPNLTMGEDGNIKYDHTKEPVLVANGNIVTYTIRIYNEGTMSGYASEVTDDLPEGLVFLPENETNVEYRWKMIDKDGNETDKVEEAVKITTDYLSKDQEKEAGQNLLKGFNKKAELSDTNPDHRDVKIAFKVTEPNTSDRILINTAEISEDEDEEGEPVDDVDSTPGNEDPDEDDIDIEKVKVRYFDLALKKWVTQAIVIENGKESITETGHTGDENPEPVVKVDLQAKKLNQVTVKFRYKIKVTNEGQIEGYVKEIKDYIPDGLRFNAKDNPKWTQLSEKEVVTDQCKDLLLGVGESTTVEIVLTWENSGDNLGLKVNWAEISKDYNEYEDTPDIDSTPNNKKPEEDDIDQAPVLLAIKTGETSIYFTLGAIILVTLAGGIILIKKFVL